jgi:vitamin B12/bleomycin/antimicrobial peptide transport system ATP-binding/permease protein
LATDLALRIRDVEEELSTRKPAAAPPIGDGPPREPPPISAALAEAASILSDLKASPFRRRVILLAGGLVLILAANAAGQVCLNIWQGNFFSAVGKKDGSLIAWQLLLFLGLVPLLLGVVVAQTWTDQMFKVTLRRWLTGNLLDHWLVPGRAYRLNIASPKDLNPDQRIQEDVRNFSEMTSDLGVGLISALLLLCSFVGVLWVLSAQVHFF